MKKGLNKQLNKLTYELFAGDYYATNERDIVMSTLLGSCISVCLLDTVNKVAGMNHFMLPSAVRGNDIIFNEDARYGIQSMEMMINAMMKKGAHRLYLKAKVFGGGKVLDTTTSNVAKSNIEFAINYLKMEDIPILAKDVGGESGRKIYFFPDTFEIYLKRIRYNKTLEHAVARERQFLDWMKKQKASTNDDNLTLFD
ncbi:hypothetical protein BHU72_02180 [Desulfuribacillus stibiiarsenatis]|uniref:Probable chemoreceptor glutamine deamidase CheD n=1 Tax=Desulfuribacillus stibiiarsenatis TaxID=1390249 RepID=A0A1E5L6F6_9FIRM|nr:hypothetical protein [Desulfuribacillus stibiiarsenatis]OEH85628.1 hypothetical protein BHU72_02180 [Desulfuribacillus stibiiarsenatis]